MEPRWSCWFPESGSVMYETRPGNECRRIMTTWLGFRRVGKRKRVANLVAWRVS